MPPRTRAARRRARAAPPAPVDRVLNTARGSSLRSWGQGPWGKACAAGPYAARCWPGQHSNCAARAPPDSG
eukprot:364819-Chlamydomonas_euryale.AAC.5